MMGGERLAAWEPVVVVAINYRVKNTKLINVIIITIEDF